MFASLKNKLANFIIKKKYVKKNQPVLSFNNFFTESVFYLVIMPQEDKDFLNSLSILKFLIDNNKNITVFLPEKSLNLVPARGNLKFLTYTEGEVSMLNLPKRSYVKRLKKKSFDVIIDLNVFDNVFAAAISNIIESSFRICLIRNNSDIYYNLQFPNDKNNSEISYKNLLNSLGMF